MRYLNKNEYTELKAVCLKAVQEAEEWTTAEIVPVYLHRSDLHSVAHYRAGLVGSFFMGSLGLIPLLHSPVSTKLALDYAEILVLFMAFGLLAGHMLAYIPQVKKIFLTSKDCEVEAHQTALEAFFNLGLTTTPERNAVLLFVSELERRIEIIPDVKALDKIDIKEWQKIEKNLAHELKAKRNITGMAQAILEVGEVLKNQFPRHKAKNESENLLSDELSKI